MQANEAMRDRVKRPAENTLRARRQGHERARALKHLPRGPARERQQHDPLRRGALGHQPCHARAQGHRLPGTGARQDQQRTVGVGRRRSLVGIQPLEPARLGRCRC